MKLFCRFEETNFFVIGGGGRYPEISFKCSAATSATDRSLLQMSSDSIATTAKAIRTSERSGFALHCWNARLIMLQEFPQYSRLLLFENNRTSSLSPVNDTEKTFGL